MRQPTNEERAAAGRFNMQGFDDYPRSLREFMHEYGTMPAPNFANIAKLLRMGNVVTLMTPDGKRHVLQPDVRTYYYSTATSTW